MLVMPGLVRGTHVFLSLDAKTWMAGTGPAMTTERYDMPDATR
jgi:hypothetical protein